MEWQPIKTAPRNGTPIDLWHKDGFRVTETWWDDVDECWSSCDDDSEFTHWMPMPTAPSNISVTGPGAGTVEDN